MEDQLQAIADKASCLRAMCDGAQSLNEVTARIEALFSDDDNGARIVLSTTHKAKGLERDNVYLLRDTYLKRDKVEETNLYYVACTRAKTNLYLVRDEKGGDE
jgi:superfamily I DNA/RNA helicase